MMIHSFLRWILGVTCTLALIIFSIFNRDLITIHLGPLQEPAELPLYAIAIGFMVIGFLVGGTLVWLNHATLRQTRKLQKKQIRTLERELEAVNQNQPVITTAEKIQTALLSKH